MAANNVICSTPHCLPVHRRPCKPAIQFLIPSSGGPKTLNLCAQTTRFKPLHTALGKLHQWLRTVTLQFPVAGNARWWLTSPNVRANKPLTGLHCMKSTPRNTPQTAEPFIGPTRPAGHSMCAVASTDLHGNEGRHQPVVALIKVGGAQECLRCDHH